MRSFALAPRAILALAVSLSLPLTATHAAAARASAAVPASTVAAKSRKSAITASQWPLYVLAAAVLAAIVVAISASSGDDKEDAVSRGLNVWLPTFALLSGTSGASDSPPYR